jgi:NADPH-dependent 2,4-dienoyl-CoA reductase/sulfur reductase-like enzyme/rhodanese-related sulfurtransferase
VKGITVMTGTVAQSIDRAQKLVHVVNTESGASQALPYDKLVISTGGIHVTPPLEGINLNRIFRLGHPEDAIRIRDLITSGAIKRAVIIGAGLIGMETTEAFVRRGLKVTIIEMLPHVLPRLLDPEMAAFLTNYLCTERIEVRANERVLRIVGDENSNVTAVVTNKGEIPADIVLLSIGVRANVHIAKDAGLQIGATGGVAVNQYMQTSDPDIYAAGDCVENTHLVSGQKSYAPMGSTANKQGRVIADHIAGQPDSFKGITGTAVLKVLTYNVGKTGLTEQEARAAGYNVVTALNPANDCSHFYPTCKRVLMKMVADADTRRVLGLQVVGPGDGVKRIDVIATALQFGATVDDIAGLDLGYAPPYSEALDLVIHTANIIRNKLSGIARGLSPAEVLAKLNRGDDFVWLDVRSQAEYDENHIDDPRIKLIPLGNLRERSVDLPRDREIVTFCAISLRAYEAQRILLGEGFSDVKFMDGGIVSWPYAKSCFIAPATS